MTDKLCQRYFELQKPPKKVKAGNGLELWLSLFNAQSEEELERLERLEVPEVNQAIEAYHQITVTSEFREAGRLRSKARRDEAQALYNAEIKTRHDEKRGLALKLLKRKRPIDEIIEDTELSREEAENLLLSISNN